MPKDDPCTVFVRSLPYDATDAALEEHFSEVGPVRSAFVVKDRATQQGRGFGFVTFALPEDAQQAVSTLSGSLFQGRKLALDVAKSGAEAAAAGHKRKPAKPAVPGASADGASSAAPEDAAAKKAKRGPRPVNPKQCRLIVRNLSFKCDEAALRSLFEPQGSVVEVHVPMRPNGKHPGFAFVQARVRRLLALALPLPQPPCWRDVCACGLCACALRCR